MKGKGRLLKIIHPAVFFVFLCLPLLAINKHHDCRYDDCMMIFCDGKLGDCVEKAIDDICAVIGVFFWLPVYGGLMVISKDRNAISPYIIMLLLIMFSVMLAFIDPSKWLFAASLLPSFIFMIVICYMDNKNRRGQMKGKHDNN